MAIFPTEKRVSADVLVIPCWKKKEGVDVPKEFSSFVQEPIDAKDFKGDLEEILFLYPKGQKEKRFLLLGLGKPESFSTESARKAYAAVVKACYRKKITSLNVLLPQIKEISREELIRGSVEGLLLGNYDFLELKHDTIKGNPPVLVEKIHLIGLSGKEKKIVEKAEKIVSCVITARNLVNRNADDVTPQTLAHFAKHLHPKVKTTVFDKKRIEKEKMGLLLAVNRGGSQDPTFIISSYKGLPGKKEHIVLVGKGITYDTGGLNLKASGMETMKGDMAGGAAVLGCVQAAALLGLKKNITAIVPSTENAIGSKAFKPGDVYRAYSGKTVEITNTDAEGRLVLADGLSYAMKHLEPTCLIDVGTLTGGIVVALGEEIAGLFTNRKKMGELLEKASKASGEMLWSMPLHLDYKKLLKSDVADLKNSAGRQAHPIQAALFLQDFVGTEMPWTHLDIAGPAFLSKACGYHPIYGTGFGIRLLIEFLEHLPDKIAWND